MPLNDDLYKPFTISSNCSRDGVNFIDFASCHEYLYPIDVFEKNPMLLC